MFPSCRFYPPSISRHLCTAKLPAILPSSDYEVMSCEYKHHRMVTSSCRGHVDELATLFYFCTASMGQVELKLLRSTDSFRRDLKTFLFYSVCGHLGWLFTIVCRTYATTDVVRHTAYRRYELFTKSVLNLISRTPGRTCATLR